MAASRPVLAILASILLFTFPARADELCEDCWDLGGKAGWLIPSDDSGTEPDLSLGFTAAFRFRPFWLLESSLDYSQTRLENGPEETILALSVAPSYTFRAGREQRSRFYLSFIAGVLSEALDGQTGKTRVGGVTVTSTTGAADDISLMIGLGAGARIHLKDKAALHLEARRLEYSTFGVSQSALWLHAGVLFRLGY